MGLASPRPRPRASSAGPEVGSCTGTAASRAARARDVTSAFGQESNASKRKNPKLRPRQIDSRKGGGKGASLSTWELGVHVHERERDWRNHFDTAMRCMLHGSETISTLRRLFTTHMMGSKVAPASSAGGMASRPRLRPPQPAWHIPSNACCTRIF